MGAFVVPVYLVPALTAVLAAGLVAEGAIRRAPGRPPIAVATDVYPEPDEQAKTGQLQTAGRS